ncbi:MAG: MoaD/ThiS family protein [Aeromicrobium sp.]|jgi:molybdopterin converting factor small subunit|nr:MoaD/ThiS family protein [Aeromicrobium sp.]
MASHDPHRAAPATVRMLAFLHTHRRERGLPTTVALELPAPGASVADLARTLELPLDLVEGAFVNGELVGLGATVRPGDRVAMVPPGTPASHPAFFGRRGIEAHAVI